MGKQAIVITTINAPNEAIRKFSRIAGWNAVVIGDHKTPSPWQFDGSKFIGVDQQKKLPYAILKKLPYNHYCRKMIGYLHAMENGAEIIYDTDDDNIPYENWYHPPFDGLYNVTAENIGFVNIYKKFTEQKIWPRGFPLELMLQSFNDTATELLPCSVGVWQGLANGEPDVDAVYRLTINKPVKFDANTPVVLNKGAICPFNSQNTFFRKEIFALLYLPAFVSFRFTDILRGYIAQAIMWSQNFLLGFFEATVLQERNPHNLLQDFKQEIDCYLIANQLPEIIGDAVKPAHTIEENLYNIYVSLHKEKIVPTEEISLLENWLIDINTCGRN